MIFIRHDCPLANRYVPEIERLRAAYEPKSVAFRSIYLDAKESPELIAAHRRAYQISLPAFRDPLHRLAVHVGAKVTPEVSLVAADGRIVYGGRIDDRVARLGKFRAQAGRHDLALAIDALLDERPVDQPRTPAMGCYIPGIPGTEMPLPSSP